MTDLLSILAEYDSALDAALAETAAPVERTYYYERLCAVRDIATAISDGQIGRAASIFNEETRIVGWEQMPGGKGAAAQELLNRCSKAVCEARFENAPDSSWQYQR